MNLRKYGNSHSPVILVVQSSFQKIEFDSLILSIFKIVYLYESENISTLSWIQQNQPDVIVLELDLPRKTCGSLITSLKLDWLTRDIPVLVTGNKFARQSIADLDYDTFVGTPYLAKNLCKAICSLTSSPFCQTYVS